jgi:O-methyltransferase
MNSLTRIWDELQAKRIAKSILPYTLVSPERVHNLYRLARRIEREHVPGDVIECGVCNGGSAAVLARSASRSRMTRTVWLLDSFEGMPAVTAYDADGADGHTAKSHVGKEVGNIEQVKSALKSVGADMARIRIVPGWFQDTFPSVTASHIAILNIDADWYESVKLCLETFYDRVVPGGFISFDDYGHWPGCRKAVDEFFQARKLPYRLNQVDYTAHWFQKA